MKMYGTAIIATTALSLIVGCVTFLPAVQAAPNGQTAPAPAMDVFSTVTAGNKTNLSAAAQKVASMTPSANPVGQGAMAMMSSSSPALTWFEKFDEICFSLMPSDTDRVILKTNFNQEAERVIAWTKTAAKVAHNYRLLAKTLKTSPVPAGHPALQDYQTLMSDWYNDKASVYEDLIRPRPPARTMEELEDQLKEINARADSIASTQKELHLMDMHLRDTYKVHQPRQTDKLWAYVSGQQVNHKF